ncbi:MAG TPA: hypothetical protein PKK96_04340 [Anaerolineales bacterium]|nr:hypothetical protein [Anaerolineales bacterium]HNQ96127.1 hypothetical protein [Anaerolineales bacterium]HNS60212.1 hypothetical protein [Anaerolineales bacterium]
MPECQSFWIRNFGSSVINGKELYHEGHEAHTGKKRAFAMIGFSFVAVVSFVFEKSFHVKNGRAGIFKLRIVESLTIVDGSPRILPIMEIDL